MSEPMLRPEARPLKLEDLWKEQRKAIESVVGLLDKAVKQVKQTGGRDQEPPDLDDKRSSRIVFLTGEPGTGKTTVYTSLRGEMEERGDRAGRETDQDVKTLLNQIQNLRKSVVWLEPLDLEPLPESTNFLAAMLVRIERAVQRYSSLHVGAPHPHGMLDPRSAAQNYLVPLKSLQNDVVAWHGNVQSRAGKVDPDNYAAEVLRAERARVAINKRFQEALESLPGINSGASRPLFVLVVDDVYLNPDASIGLLRLLRMISSPQLFVLLLGDYDTLEFLFNQEALGSYIKLAGEVAYRIDHRLRSRIKARSRTLTAGALRKLVPPAHQIKLHPLEADEALDFTPLDRREGTTQTLGQLLEKLPIQEDDPRLTSVGKLLTVDWVWRDQSSDPPKLSYLGTRLLEMPPRHATDLWMTLEAELPPAKAADKTYVTVKILGSQLYAAWDEQNRLPDEEREGIQSASAPAFTIDDYSLDTSRLEIQIDKRRKEESRPADIVRGSSTIEVFRRVQWDLALTLKNEGQPRKIEFVPRPMGWLTVLHDVLALCRGQSLTNGSLLERGEKDSKLLPIRHVEVEYDEISNADPRATWIRVRCKFEQIGQSRTVGLRAPRWKTIWEFDLLNAAWNSLIKETAQFHPDAYVFRWLDAIVEILTRRLELTKFEGSVPPNGDNWEALAKRLGKLAKEREYDPVTAEWISYLGCLVAARIGIPNAAAECFEQEQTLKDYWNRTAATELKKWRQQEEENLAKFIADSVPENWPN